MAGIGFELKKLFANQSILLGLRGYMYAAFVTVGPILLVIGMLVPLKELLEYLGIPYAEREILMAAIMYAFSFSLVISSGFAIVLSRYMADKLYSEEYEDIVASLFGVLGLAMLVGGIAGTLFYWRAPLPFEFKLGAYNLYMELIVMFLLMVYVSALKDYKKITYSFLAGTAIDLVCALIFIRYLGFREIEALLYALNIGFFVIIVSIISNIQQYFPSNNHKYFDFLIYFQEKPMLFFINFFYTLGIFVHNMIFWFSPLGIRVADTYVYAPSYDVPTFYAMLTILPATVIFVVKVETSFYEKYKGYFEAIAGNRTLNDILMAKKSMIRLLSEELTFIMEVQLLITVAAIVLGKTFLPALGITALALELFSFLSLGNYTMSMMFIIMTILLYFDDQRGAMLVSAVFLFCNVLFSYLSIFMGEDYYGIGFLAAGLVALITSIIRLRVLLNHIDYRIFCSQPILAKVNESKFAKFIKDLGG